ncbi:tyrosinase family oxidase copper chaperone [Streptomyces sp. NPDC088745]|uniref:tyrosinase family oxidase copper chaperone n=1 Tax=Streptomyces sp. NPDC088745 TaxID=3365884 RepID=UPI0037F9B7BA
MKTPTGHGAGRPGTAATPALTARRAVLRTVFGAGVVAGTAAALAPVVGKREATAGPHHGPAFPAAGFSEMYRGRLIEGTTPSGRVSPLAALAESDTRHPPEVRVDGRPLHLMRCADGSYLSVVNHYESFPTPLAAARAAVDDLGPAQLSRTPLHTN